MDDWVLDSLVGFLKSPTWTLAVSGFTDKNCLVFDPGEENKFSYTDIHREYQKLVEELLEKFTAELGITGDQFTHACSLLQTSKTGQENVELFEQVLAADDFLLFKENMVRRNIDMELQALSLLQKQVGHSPNAYDKEGVSRDNGASNRKKLEEEEERMLEEAVKRSEAQYQLERSMEDEELQRMIEEAKRQSLQLYQAQQMTKEEMGGQQGTMGGEGGERDLPATNDGGEPIDQPKQTGSGEDVSSQAKRNDTSSPRTPTKTTVDSCDVAQNVGREVEAEEPPALPSKELPPLDKSTPNTGTVGRGVEAEEPPAPPSKELPPLDKSTPNTGTVGREVEAEEPPAPPSKELPPLDKSTPNTRTVVTTEGGEKREERGGGEEEGEDAMTKWLEVAKAGLSNEAAGSTHSHSTRCQHTAGGPTPEQLRARELYLKQQRDHLMEAKRKQRAASREPSSVGGARKGQQSTRREASSSAGGERESTGVRSGGGRRGKDTGILSSAIAGNLKKV